MDLEDPVSAESSSDSELANSHAEGDGLPLGATTPVAHLDSEDEGWSSDDL
jgi:hypothetical protein